MARALVTHRRLTALAPVVLLLVCLVAGTPADAASPFTTFESGHVGPAALKLRPDLIEGVERRLCFRFHVWPRQFTAKPNEKAICKSLETGKRYRFLALCRQ